MPQQHAVPINLCFCIEFKISKVITFKLLMLPWVTFWYENFGCLVRMPMITFRPCPMLPPCFYMSPKRVLQLYDSLCAVICFPQKMYCASKTKYFAFHFRSTLLGRYLGTPSMSPGTLTGILIACCRSSVVTN